MKLFESEDTLTLKEASVWASKYTGKKVTVSNISYLIQYGRIQKSGTNGNPYINKSELVKYYESFKNSREAEWKVKLGQDLNWSLSFEEYKESETTKHVHRLHPYKGKYIPQLVEYFIDTHTDNFKQTPFFEVGDIIIDPFSGSGTTMVQACENGIHTLGIDISSFNSFIGNCKVARYNINEIKKELNKLTLKLIDFNTNYQISSFDIEVTNALNSFNHVHFPVPDYKIKIKKKEIDENTYSEAKEAEFLIIFSDIKNKYNLQIKSKNEDSFLGLWYTDHIREEVDFLHKEIQLIENKSSQDLISLILSRTIRSCRATTHSDLATLIKPIFAPYYCSKHGKICKPLFSIFKWWSTYSQDTIKRVLTFDRLRTNTYQYCLSGDSRRINFIEELRCVNPDFANMIETKRAKGIFTSPPYVGLINYHEQHAYAYELLGFKRKDEYEIGPLFKGQSKEAQTLYINSIAKVLINCKRIMVDDYHVFLVANDKYNLYPQIAQLSGMKIINQYKRPVLNRTEKDKGAYAESIFHLKSKE